MKLAIVLQDVATFDTDDTPRGVLGNVQGAASAHRRIGGDAIVLMENLEILIDWAAEEAKEKLAEIFLADLPEVYGLALPTPSVTDARQKKTGTNKWEI
jgi:hypothetical protein